MQRTMMIAAALSVLTLSDANAADWCGYGSHAKSFIECGYSSVTDCESAVGKGGMCFVDPDYAANAQHHIPSWPGLSGLSWPSTTLVSLKN